MTTELFYMAEGALSNLVCVVAINYNTSRLLLLNKEDKIKVTPEGLIIKIRENEMQSTQSLLNAVSVGNSLYMNEVQ